MNNTTSSGSAAVVIPARYESSRLPGKLLLDETGKYLVQHVYENAAACDHISNVYVATNSDRIAEACASFDAGVLRTGDHPSGTSRICEASQDLEEDLILNIQGDEPEVGCREIHGLLNLMETGSWSMGTLSTPIRDVETLRRPSCVKVVCGAERRALYFTRAPVPWEQNEFPSSGNLFETPPDLTTSDKNMDGSCPWQLHLGIYGYTRELIQSWNQLSKGRLEQIEGLEQLRAIENNIDIGVQRVEAGFVGVDTREEYESFVRRYES